MTIEQGHAATTARYTALRGGLEVIEDDASADGLARRWARTAFWAPFAGVVLMGLIFLVHRPYFYTVQLEDHPIEWAQFSLCLFTCVVSAFAAVRFARSGRPWLAALMMAVALGALMLAGEEISWGQRVFGLATPQQLGARNQQDELNLHNIDVGFDAEDLFKALEFVMGVVAVTLALLARPLNGRLHRTTWWLISPPLFTLPGFAAIALYRAVMLTPIEINPLIAFQEYVELTLYLSLAATAVCYYVRATPGRYQVDLTGPDALRAKDSRVRISARPLLLTGVAIVVLTIVFAILSAHSGILPGNLPGRSG